MNYFKERYYFQLNSLQWKAFRKEFIARKGGRCELCGKTGPGLQVHHRCYRENVRAWDYPDSDLQCLCLECHRKVHIALCEEGGRIPVLDAAGYAVKLTDGQRCRWCGGSGYLEEFRHLLGGVCFRCFGTGVRFVHRYSREEAWRYGQKIYRQWLDYHEARLSRFYVPRFTSAAQVRDWLLDMNEEQ